MKKISTGEDSTLKTYRGIAVVMCGEDSLAVEFFDRKIKNSVTGENEEVTADESQMLLTINSMRLAELEQGFGLECLAELAAKYPASEKAKERKRKLMKKISTGEDSTLKTYRGIAVVMCGEDSKAVEFIDKRINHSDSENTEVIADESQMLLLFSSMCDKDEEVKKCTR